MSRRRRSRSSERDASVFPVAKYKHLIDETAATIVCEGYTYRVGPAFSFEKRDNSKYETTVLDNGTFQVFVTTNAGKQVTVIRNSPSEAISVAFVQAGGKKGTRRSGVQYFGGSKVEDESQLAAETMAPLCAAASFVRGQVTAAVVPTISPITAPPIIPRVVFTIAQAAASAGSVTRASAPSPPPSAPSNKRAASTSPTRGESASSSPLRRQSLSPRGRHR
eukprot:TRINITY_DN676_c0_g1_i3.p1 TRINITY_DN676_c0_g1~~TRINITY_DN676_c0_g1_i3.p1  ORF type:complete len:221 (-),score=19.72 TRINITY_DN676_c0_g1_i3:76-738(-)